jgi:hypothetical protein
LNEEGQGKFVTPQCCSRGWVTAEEIEVFELE